MAHHVDALLEQLCVPPESSSEPERGELWDALRSAGLGGKQFRPALVLTAHSALDGQEHHAALRVAAAVELLHTALLAHDDVIDDDAVRRSRPNISGTYAADARRHGLPEEAAHRYGDTAGILAGDLALVRAVRTVATCGAPTPVIAALLDQFDRTMDASAAGELADVRLGLGLSGNPVTMAEALEVAEQKTAAYSFRFPLRAGALLAGASDPILARLDEVARLLGIGFQLVDDLLGVFGDAALTGKSTLSDLREGKGTALIAAAAKTPHWDALRPLLGDPLLDEAGAEQARALLTSGGARAATESIARQHLAEAMELAAPLPRDLHRALTVLCHDILVRIPAPARAPQPTPTGERS